MTPVLRMVSRVWAPTGRARRAAKMTTSERGIMRGMIRPAHAAGELDLSLMSAPRRRRRIIRLMRPSRHVWLLVALLAACGTAPQWEKSGATEAQRQADSDDCRSQARTTPHPAELPTQPTSSMTERVMERNREVGTQDTRVFQSCMQKKGYS